MALKRTLPVLDVGNAHEVSGEKIGCRLVETPVGQSDARVDTLQLPLQIQQVGPMPRRETGVLVRLRIPGTAVHVAKIREAAHPCVVQGRESREQAIALGGAKRVGVLADPHHQGRGADGLVVRGVDDLYVHVAIGNAGPLEPAGEKELHRRACKRQGQSRSSWAVLRNGGEEDDLPALSDALILQAARSPDRWLRLDPTAGLAPAPAPSRHSGRRQCRRR